MAVKKSVGDILADVQKELGNLKSIQGRDPFEFESESEYRAFVTQVLLMLDACEEVCPVDGGLCGKVAGHGGFHQHGFHLWSGVTKALAQCPQYCPTLDQRQCVKPEGHAGKHSDGVHTWSA